MQLHTLIWMKMTILSPKTSLTILKLMQQWHVSIGCHSIVLHNVLCMPQNPTCTLSTGALKILDGFICARHDALATLLLVSPHGIDKEFNADDGTMKTINGLDYVPIVTHLPNYYMDFSTVPDPHEHPDGEGYISANAAIAQLPRRSNRIRRPPLKLRSPSPSATVHPLVHSSPKPPFVTPHPSISSNNVNINLPAIIKIPHKLPLTTSDDDTSIGSPRDTKPKKEPPIAVSIPHINTILTHLKFGCRNMKNVIHMKKHNSLSNLPSHLKELSHICPICAKCKLTRLPRNPPLPVSMLRPGQMLQMDFGFYNVKSVRGFSSFLSVDCVQTKYSFAFCTRRKRSPIDIIRWILSTLSKLDKQVNFVRFDEGGELARCEELNGMLVDEFNVVMQTTGGYASHLNGVTECGHMSTSNSVRTSLYAAGLDDTYWCFALMHSNFINRRWCRLGETQTPYEKWHKTIPSFNKLHIFGATLYVHNHSAKKLDNKATTGIFLGFGASTAIIYYLDPLLSTIKRTHHARFDDLQVGGNDMTPGSCLIRKHADIHNIILPPSSLTLATVDSPFTLNSLFSYEVTIAPTGPLGLNLENDQIFGLPIINYMSEDSPFKIGCKKTMQKNAWIVGVHHDEPVTVNRFLEYLDYLRENKIFTFQMTLTKRIDHTATNYQLYRSYFDNFRPIASHATIVLPEAKYAFQTPTKPITPRSWVDVIQGDMKDIWYKAVYERYDKNHQVGLLSVPIPASQLPKDTIILRAVSAFKIKKTSHPNIFDFYFRMCADGSKQIKGLHFNESHSPTPSIWTILTCTCVAASLDLTAYTIDIDNAFQNTPRYPTKHTKPIFITCPPLYLPWLKTRFPHYSFLPNTKYVLQCFMNMQGLRTAGRDFHALLKAILADLHIHPTSVDNGIFVFRYKDSIVLLAISTDDILIFTKYVEFYNLIKEKLNTAFGVTSQKDNIIYYLNYRIIQSQYAISIDQTQFIIDIVRNYIPANSKCPRVDTPLRTDRQFDLEILESVPATPSELKQLAIQYKGEYRTIFGQLCHIMKASRPDLSNAINRLGIFQVAPNKLAFQSIYRVLQYLHTHPNVPLVYPRQAFNASSCLQVYSSKGDLVDSLKIPHCLCGHVDISFAPHREHRHSVGGHVETLNCVAVDWRTMKQTSCATSATDAETRQYYDAAKRILRLRQFLRQIGLSIPDASPILPSFQLNYDQPSPIFEDNKGTRDMLAGGKVTSNLKHVDIPLTYLHALHESATIKTLEASSGTMLANFLTKQETGPQHLKSLKWISGRKFYPPRTSDHFKTLTSISSLTLL